VIPQTLITRLQTGTITNVVQFGTSVLPAPPYVVLKFERDPAGRGRALRVITHYEPDQQKWLEDYVFDQLSDLLLDYVGETDEGVNFRVHGTQEWTDIITGNDDGTISMERVFLLPGLLF
jgi:hypothetical protein